MKAKEKSSVSLNIHFIGIVTNHKLTSTSLIQQYSIMLLIFFPKEYTFSAYIRK